MKNTYITIFVFLIIGGLLTSCKTDFEVFGGDATIYGVVTYKDPVTQITSPVNGCTLTLSVTEGKNKFENVFSLKTDTEGQFTISGLETSTQEDLIWTLKAEIRNGDVICLGSVSIPEKPGTLIYPIDFEVSPSLEGASSKLTLILKYKDPFSGDSLPVPSCSLTVTPLGSLALLTSPQTLVSGTDGYITFNSLLPGSWAVNATKAVSSGTYLLDTSLTLDSNQVLVKGFGMTQSSLSIYAHLRFENILSRVVTDFPASTSVVLMRDDGIIASDTGTVMSGGSVSFINLNAGHYRMAAEFSLSGVPYKMDTSFTLASTLLNYQSVTRHNTPGSIRIQVVNNSNTPQPGATAFYFSNASAWSDSTLNTGAADSQTTGPLYSYALFQGLAPGSSYFFAGYRILPGDTLQDTATVPISILGLTEYKLKLK